MTVLLLLGLLLADWQPPPKAEASLAGKPDDSIIRPAAPAAEPVSTMELRDERRPAWGLTAALGMGAIVDGRAQGVALWGGLRHWLGPNVIASGLVSFQQFESLTDLAFIARLELAAATKHDRLFPSFSAYVGAGPELFSRSAGTAGGLRLVIGVHLPTIWSGIFGVLNSVNDVGLALLLLVPTALEVQFRTGGGAVAPSTAIVLALAI